jgi:hypothetical protein
MKVSTLFSPPLLTKTLSAIATIGLVASGAMMTMTGTKIQNTNVLLDGVGTCFQRVSQSYTARVIGDRASGYLEAPFLASTEECFTEAVDQADKRLGKNAPDIKNKLNALAQDVHWYQERLNAQVVGGPAGTPESVMVANLGTRFQRLEVRKDELAAELEGFRSQFNQELTPIRVFFWSFAVIAPFMLIFSLFRESHLAAAIQTAELEAGEAGEFDRANIEAFINRALTSVGLSGVSRAFETYRLRTLATGSATLETAVREDKAGEARPVMASNQKELDAQIDQIWGEEEGVRAASAPAWILPKNHITEAGSNNATGADVEESLTRVLDLLSSKVFSLGVQIDVQAEGAPRVRAHNEEIDQAFYHALVHACGNATDNAEAKRVSVSTRRLGGTLFVDIFESGGGFSTDFLKSWAGLAPNEANERLELRICKELVEDIGGKVTVGNVTNEDGTPVGANVQIALAIDNGDRVQQGPRLMDVKKGKKRKILEAMDRNA